MGTPVWLEHLRAAATVVPTGRHLADHDVNVMLHADTPGRVVTLPVATLAVPAFTAPPGHTWELEYTRRGGNPVLIYNDDLLHAWLDVATVYDLTDAQVVVTLVPADDVTAPTVGDTVRGRVPWWPQPVEVDDRDTAVCTCGAVIYRTNMDGRWHHPGRVPLPHEAAPQATMPGDDPTGGDTDA